MWACHTVTLEFQKISESVIPHSLDQSRLHHLWVNECHLNPRCLSGSCVATLKACVLFVVYWPPVFALTLGSVTLITVLLYLNVRISNLNMFRHDYSHFSELTILKTRETIRAEETRRHVENVHSPWEDPGRWVTNELTVLEADYGPGKYMTPTLERATNRQAEKEENI